MSDVFKNTANITPDDLNRRWHETMLSALGIRYTEIGPDYLKARMPVDERTIQPLGMLNGGASMALVENVASAAANLAVDRDKYVCFGMEINGNHLRPVLKGAWVEATAKPLYLGKTSQVWEVMICDDRGKLVCAARMTMAVKEI